MSHVYFRWSNELLFAQTIRYSFFRKLNTLINKSHDKIVLIICRTHDLMKFWNIYDYRNEELVSISPNRLLFTYSLCNKEVKKYLLREDLGKHLTQKLTITKCQERCTTGVRCGFLTL